MAVVVDLNLLALDNLSAAAVGYKEALVEQRGTSVP